MILKPIHFENEKSSSRSATAFLFYLSNPLTNEFVADSPNKKAPLLRGFYHSSVIATGFEPVTVCLEGRCSIQLSYATILCFAKESSWYKIKQLLILSGCKYKRTFQIKQTICYNFFLNLICLDWPYVLMKIKEKKNSYL